MGDTTPIQASAVKSIEPIPFYGDDKSSTIECTSLLSEDRTKYTHVFSLPYKKITLRQHSLACGFLDFARMNQNEAAKSREMAAQATAPSQKKTLLLQARTLELSAVCLTDVATNFVVTEPLSPIYVDIELKQILEDCTASGFKQARSELQDVK